MNVENERARHPVAIATDFVVSNCKRLTQVVGWKMTGMGNSATLSDFRLFHIDTHDLIVFTPVKSVTWPSGLLTIFFWGAMKPSVWGDIFP